jgi:hypothetical protein
MELDAIQQARAERNRLFFERAIQLLMHVYKLPREEILDWLAADDEWKLPQDAEKNGGGPE